MILIAESTSSVRAGRPVVSSDGIVDPVVVTQLNGEAQQRIVADSLAQADVRIQLGLAGDKFRPASNGRFEAVELAKPQPGQFQERITSQSVLIEVTSAAIPYGVEVTLLNP